MKRLIALPLLLLACTVTAAPPTTSPGDEAAQATREAARAGDDAARAGNEATLAGEEASRQAADAQKLAELQARMNDLAQRMAELSVKVGDQASASALRYLADSRRGMLGIVLEDDGAAGLRVAAVTPGGPAERAGIRDGDVITAINGANAGAGGDSVLADALVAGKPVSLAVSRGGENLRFHVTPERFQTADWQALARTAQAAAQQSLAKLNSPEFRKQLDHRIDEAMKQTEEARADMAAQWGKSFALNGRWFAPWWGLNLASLNPQLGHYFGTDSGALVLSVDGKSYPGLESGDVITAVDGHAVEKPGDVMRALQSLPADATAHLEVVRHGKQLALNFKVPARGYLLPPVPPEPPAPPAMPNAPAAPPLPPVPPPPPVSKGVF
ncbi:MAG: PDZ domain-containing protein [Rhodanobacteraceae bacterium]